MTRLSHWTIMLSVLWIAPACDLYRCEDGAVVMHPDECPYKLPRFSCFDGSTVEDPFLCPVRCPNGQTLQEFLLCRAETHVVCSDGRVVATASQCGEGDGPGYPCPDGTLVYHASQCPAPPSPPNVCPDGTVVATLAQCQVTCPDGTVASDASQCAPAPSFECDGEQRAFRPDICPAI
jgi:hypothetical protein